MASEHECQETYQECMANRKARIERVIAENPDATQAQLAEKAGVALRTIKRHDGPRYTKVSRGTFDPAAGMPAQFDPISADTRADPPRKEVDNWIAVFNSWPLHVKRTAIATLTMMYEKEISDANTRSKLPA